MSLELWLYLAGAFAILAYSAYIETDDPLVSIFFAVIWPVALAVFVPVFCGFAVRRLTKGKAK